MSGTKGNASTAPAITASNPVLAILALVRPAQWLKNLLVFAALVFSHHLFDPAFVAKSLVAFAGFCLIASAAYVMNDWRDLEHDREHPEKCHRPLAAGQVSPWAAIAIAIGLAAAAAFAALWVGGPFVIVLVAYAVLQISYSFALKDVVILDVMAIAAGFVLRAVGGGLAIEVEVSPWLVICTFLLALFLGFSKRRHEVVLLAGRAAEHRASLADYSAYFLDQMISVVTAATVVAYAIYTVSPEVQEKLGTDALYLTIPFVLYGIFRYLYLIHQRSEGGNPTHLLVSDRPLQLNVALWIATAVWLLYA